ncbi:head decoration protein [Shewanella surugensis]|uniref:Head decoration protein n=1 Tax=Shewanella surugensis TaxID=212020 RepID=A0ABT0L8Y2_9GAMM|nr:head decoration protein [Shewanella surugensis]MCL1124154.1 head decoration protein [Shewanella surugensis]
MMEKQTYTPDDYVIKKGDFTRRYIKAGESFPARTPLMPDETDKTLLVKWDGSVGTAVSLSVCLADSPAGNELKAVIVSGKYRISEINWPDNLTDMEKRAAFQGTAISVDDE